MVDDIDFVDLEERSRPLDDRFDLQLHVFVDMREVYVYNTQYLQLRVAMLNSRFEKV